MRQRTITARAQQLHEARGKKHKRLAVQATQARGPVGSLPLPGATDTLPPPRRSTGICSGQARHASQKSATTTTPTNVPSHRNHPNLVKDLRDGNASIPLIWNATIGHGLAIPDIENQRARAESALEEIKQTAASMQRTWPRYQRAIADFIEITGELPLLGQESVGAGLVQGPVQRSTWPGIRM